jgi:hypothetical protein
VVIDLDELLTLTEAAEASPISLDALRKAAQRGRLHVRLIGRPPHTYYVTTARNVARYVAEVEARRHPRRERIERP